MSIATRTGDQGKTNLLYGRRVSKTDPRVEACGAVDELNAALGVARASASLALVRESLLGVQKNLVAFMGSVVVIAEDMERYRKGEFEKLTPEMLEELDRLVARIEGEEVSFDGWATPGASVASATLELARTVCRRAERSVVALHEGGDDFSLGMKYLNRLSDVLWLMARYTETKEAGKGDAG